MSSTNFLHFGTYTPYEKPVVSSKCYMKIPVKRDFINLRLAEAQKSKLHTDVNFTFSESKEEVAAHKLVLALSSCIFDTMFYGNTWNTGDKVEIADIHPSMFRTFIEFLYSSTLPTYISITDAIDVLYAARKYCVEDLESMLKQFLNDSITLDTVLTILKASIMFEYPDVVSKCWECIEMDTDRVVLTNAFTSLDIGTVDKLLDRDSLTISEVKLFDAVLRWGEAECNRQGIESNSSNLRSVLSKTVRKIRFPVMDPTEFADGPATSGVLSREEILNVLLTKFSSSVGKPSQIFSPKKRVPKKLLARLECKCKFTKIVCSFCQDRDGSDVIPSPVAHLFQTPTCYCCCRTRDYCPSRKIV